MTSTRRLAALTLALAASLLVLACEGSSDRQRLLVNMRGMDPHVGQLLEIRVWDANSGEVVRTASVDPIEEANFTLDLGQVLVPGRTYNVDWYADLSMNGRYDAPPTDHAWRRTIVADGPVAIDFVHDTVWVDIQFP